MRVCFDASSLIGSPTGVGRYARSLLESLLEQDPENEYVLLLAALRGRADLSFIRGHSRLRHVRKRIPGRLLLWLWERFDAPKVETLTGGFDLFHSPNFLYQPVRRGRVVATVHDLFFLRATPQTHPRGGQYLARVLQRHLVRADAVLCVSRATRHELLARFDLDPARVHAVPSGVSLQYSPVSRAERQAVLRKLDVREPYLLFVGTLEPRKNLDRLLEAHRMLNAAGGPHRLVLVGPEGWDAGLNRRVRDRSRTDAVQHLGYVPDSALPALYSGAAALVLPSLDEGFGLPVLEAMSCECPVICSDRGALPEVAGQAALYCDPERPGSILAALEAGLKEGEEREERIRSGRRRAAGFTWAQTARRTLEVYRQALTSPPLTGGSQG